MKTAQRLRPSPSSSRSSASAASTTPTPTPTATPTSVSAFSKSGSQHRWRDDLLASLDAYALPAIAPKPETLDSTLLSGLERRASTKPPATTATAWKNDGDARAGRVRVPPPPPPPPPRVPGWKRFDRASSSSSSPGRARDRDHLRDPSTPPRGVKTGEDAAMWFLSGAGGKPDATPEDRDRVVYCLHRRRANASGDSTRDARGFDPYDLVAVPYSEIDASNAKGADVLELDGSYSETNGHFAISKNGVARYLPNERACSVTIKEWLRHRKIFSTLRNTFPFFREFRARKALATWAANVRARKFAARRRQLSEKLIALHPEYSDSIRRINGLARAMEFGHGGWIRRDEDDDAEREGARDATATRWVRRTPPRSTARRLKPTPPRLDFEDDDDADDAARVGAAVASWRGTDAAVAASRRGVDIVALVTDAGRHGLGARFAALRGANARVAGDANAFASDAREARAKALDASLALAACASMETTRTVHEVTAAARALRNSSNGADADRGDAGGGWREKSVHARRAKSRRVAREAAATTRRHRSLGAFVRLSDAIVRGAMFTIARDACACYLKALRAAGTDGRPGLFLVEASIPDGSTRRVVFEPPLPELVRVARAVPETMCASIASIAVPSACAPSLSAWARACEDASEGVERALSSITGRGGGGGGDATTASASASASIVAISTVAETTAAEASAIVSRAHAAAMSSDAARAHGDANDDARAFAARWFASNDVSSSNAEAEARPFASPPTSSARDVADDALAAIRWRDDVLRASAREVHGVVALDTSEVKRTVAPSAETAAAGIAAFSAAARARVATDLVAVLASDVVALRARPHEMEPFACFVKAATPHFEGNEVSTTTRAMYDEVVHFDAVARLDACANPGRTPTPTPTPTPTQTELRSLIAAHAREAAAAKTYVDAHAPTLAIDVDKRAAIARREVLSALASCRAAPVTSADASPSGAFYMYTRFTHRSDATLDRVFASLFN